MVRWIVQTLFLLAFSMLSFSAFSSVAKIAYINSYHSEYSWSAQCFRAFKNNVPADAEITTFHLDSKRSPSKEAIQNQAAIILHELKILKPDIVVAADDNASKYIIEPYYKNTATPVVFLGVNVDPSLYKYPYKNAVGILESYSSDRFSKVQKLYFKNRRIVFIFANTTTSQRKYHKHKELYGNAYPVMLAENLTELFSKINNYSASETLFVIDNLWGLSDFDESLIKRFIESKNNILIASITNSNKNYSHLIFKQSAREQGGEAGIMVTNILKGAKVSELSLKYGAMFGFSVNEPFFSSTNTELPKGIELIESGTDF